MNESKFHWTLALTLLVGVAACDQPERADPDAGPGTPGQQALPQPEVDPETAEQLREIQSIQQQLQPIQQQAMQDEALAEQLQGIQVRIEAAMREEDSEVLARMDSLQEEMAAAQSAGDQERMQAVMMEAQSIQPELEALQTAVLERPEIRGPIEEFEAAQRARMIEINPEAEPLLDRMDELIAELSP